MENYEEARVKLIISQRQKLDFAAKSQTGTTLMTIKENFQAEDLSHELFLTTSQ